MKEENKKEILTYDNIKKEIKKMCISDLISVIPILIPSIVMIFGLYISTLMKKPSIILVIFMWALLIFFFFLYIFSSIDAIKILCALKKDKLNIVTDELVEKKEQIDFGPTKSGMLFNKPYCLNFKTKGEFFVVKRNYYIWSTKYPLNADGIYNYADVGDNFYLVTYNKRIIMIYNTKLFNVL